ncbi:Protein M3 [Physocladia obscura]|uniref:Protein M3 n=1 Tax=Physocladia obscura TaxID=109957 RepID=A0AAD5SXD9_9FUNG|nr:Protein M3 [Physocladia obscura]
MANAGDFPLAIGYTLFGEDMKAIKNENPNASTKSYTSIQKNNEEKIDELMKPSDDSIFRNYVSNDELMKEVEPRLSTQKIMIYFGFKALKAIQFVTMSLLSPANLATIIGLIIASLPAIRNIFTNPGLKTSEPPLSFLFEVLQFLGNAAVPLGLLNLGAALGRLDVKNLISSKIIFAITFCRLIAMPLIGISIVQLLVSKGIIDENAKMFRFVLMVRFNVQKLHLIVSSFKRVCPQHLQLYTLHKCGIRMEKQKQLLA